MPRRPQGRRKSPSLLKRQLQTAGAPFGASDALAEAARIVAIAAEDSIEFDWTKKPVAAKEARLRLAVIRRIEIEEMAQYAELCSSFAALGIDPPTDSTAENIRCRLEELVEPNDESLGADLYDAIEHWRTEADKAYANQKAIERQRLLRAARLDIFGGPSHA